MPMIDLWLTNSDPVALQFLHQARALLGVKFAHEGQSEAEGLDCLGLVLLSFERTKGYKISDCPRYLSPEHIAPHQGQSLGFLLPFFDRLPAYESEIGDVLVFHTQGPKRLHLAIQESPDHVIHAHHKRGVESVDFHPYWRHRHVSTLRIKE